MNFSTLLIRLGIDPANFIDCESEPIRTEKGFIYELSQKVTDRNCPNCGSANCHIHSHTYVEINCSQTSQFRDILRIRKSRLKCRECGKTFTPEIRGTDTGTTLSSQTRKMIINDFAGSLTFSQIAERYSISTARVIQIFDESIRFVPRRPLPRVLCIDEIRFTSEKGQKYCCVLYDFEKKEIVDIIKSRQMPYLDEYFSDISESERKKVKFFVSDMYDGFSTVHHRYFNGSIHIIDTFHIVTQLTNAVNRLRITAMNSCEDKNSMCYRFMKSNWKYFMCRTEDIPDRYYSSRKTEERYHFTDMIFMCTSMNSNLQTGYNILQDMFHYSDRHTYTEAEKFIEYISKRLIDSDCETLMSVGRTYSKWKVGIANTLSRNQNTIRYSNSVAENINNHIKTIIKSAYGYKNFERFRKRCMLIITYKSL